MKDCHSIFITSERDETKTPATRTGSLKSSILAVLDLMPGELLSVVILKRDVGALCGDSFLESCLSSPELTSFISLIHPILTYKTF